MRTSQPPALILSILRNRSLKNLLVPMSSTWKILMKKMTPTLLIWKILMRMKNDGENAISSG